MKQQKQKTTVDQVFTTLPYQLLRLQRKLNAQRHILSTVNPNTQFNRLVATVACLKTEFKNKALLLYLKDWLLHAISSFKTEQRNIR